MAREKAIAAIADALIRLNVEVPVNAAMQLYPNFPVQALILLANNRSGEREALLHMLADKRFQVWLTAADLLAERYPASVTPVLLNDFTMPIRIRVIDTSDAVYGTDRSGGCAGGGVYDGWAGWPKMRDYILAVNSGEGSRLLAPGRNAVYYYVEESRDFGRILHQDPCLFDPIEIERFRFELLQQLGASDLQRSAYKKISFTNGEEFTHETDSFLLEQKTAFEHAVRALVESGHLTDEQAGRRKFYVDFSIEDNRADKSVPLPVINLDQFGMSLRRLSY